MFLRRVAVSLHEVKELIAMRLDVPVKIHADEAVQLQETGVDVAHKSGIWERYLGADVASEPIDSASLGKHFYLGRLLSCMFRSTHEYHGFCHIVVILPLHVLHPVDY